MRAMDLLAHAPLILTEGSIYEKLRRDPSIRFDPELAHAALVYDDEARSKLEATHREYIDIGVAAGVPFAALTDTWRANTERIARSEWHGRDVNGDNVRFLGRVRDSYGPTPAPILIGGLTGCRGDAYAPREALETGEAERFHAPQIEALAAASVDFLLAATLPALSEARGIANAMSATGVPYIVSFVVLPSGKLLDGTPFSEAVGSIDDVVARAPVGYSVNCVHPSVFRDAVASLPPAVLRRIIAFQGNTSRRPPHDLDGLAELEGEESGVFAGETAAACASAGVRIVGGCCGTDASHVAAIARLCAAPRT